MKFRLTPLARSDVVGITEFYGNLSIILGERFINELEGALQLLCRQPELGSLRYAHLLPDRSLRMWQLDHFPFLLFYRIDGQIEVLRVLHRRRALTPKLMPD